MLDAKELGVLVIGGGTFAAALGLLIVRKRFDFRSIESHHEVGGYLLSVLGTLYSVILGFMVVDVSNHVQEARVLVGTEINSLMNVYRICDGFPQKNKEEIELGCLAYAKAVAEDEWEKMPKGITSRLTGNAIGKLWLGIKHFQPQTAQEQAFFSTVLEDFQRMCESRRTRLVIALGQVSPILWVVLIVGAVATICFTYLFSIGRLGSQLLMTVLITITLTFNLYLILVSSNPFAGDFKIKSIPFRFVASVIEHKGRVPDNIEEFR